MTPTGEVDWPALDGLIAWHLESGTNGIVPMGTTGESATLTTKEHLEVIKRTIEIVAGQIPVVAGTGSNATAEAIHQTQEAERQGADACLLVTPYYNKPTQEGLYQHYKTIAEACSVPLVLYNVPSRTACDMTAETVARLAPIENIVGIKEACGDAGRVGEIKALCDDDFVVLSGEDAQTLDMPPRCWRSRSWRSSSWPAWSRRRWDAPRRRVPTSRFRQRSGALSCRSSRDSKWSPAR